jgi:glycosyltransferase involved in cell wall biosynthesis
MKKILIVDDINTDGRRPLTVQLYKEFKRSKYFTFSLCDDINSELNEYYDLIFIGECHGNFILNSLDNIKNNNIPIIFDVTDNEELDETEYNYHPLIKEIFSHNLNITIITKYWPSKALENFCNQNNFNQSKIVCIPYGIDLNIKKAKKKIYDICFIASITDGWKWHDDRRFIRDELLKLENIFNIFIGNAYGQEYNEIISRSHIAIVEGSKRKAMTAKYLEIANEKTMLAGDLPFYPDFATKLFKNRMLVIDDWNQMNDKLIEILSNPNEIKKLTKKANNMIAKHFSIQSIADTYEQLFKTII